MHPPLSDFCVGTDEVGFGALAGPLVVAAVFAPTKWALPGLKDSKKFSSLKQREEAVAPIFLDANVRILLASCPAKVVDSLGARVALIGLHNQVIQEVRERWGDCSAVTDGNLPLRDATSIVKGDTFIPHIMAASMVAKVFRDRRMQSLATVYPAYKWGQNAGYGTQEHVQAIRSLGLTPQHRRSYCKKLQAATLVV